MKSLICYSLIVFTTNAFVPVPLKAQEPPALKLVRDVRIDASEHDLSPITAVAVSPNGTIAINQQQDGLVRFFDASGKPLGAFGRRGQGPGEFMNVGRIWWIADTLVVTDGSTRRYTLISPARTLLRTIPRPTSMSMAAKPGQEPPRFTAPIPLVLYGDGSFLATARLAEGSPPADWPGGTRPGSPYVRLDSTGAFRNVVAWRPDIDQECIAPFGGEGGRGGGSLAIPFCATVMPEVSPDGSRLSLSWLEQGTTPTFRVAAFRANGDTVFNRVYPWQPVRIPTAVRDSAIENLSRRGPDVAAALSKARIPETYPPLSSIHPGRDETTWLELYPTGPQRTYHMLDARGNAVGSVTVPRNIRLMVASRETLWAIETDEDGLQHIVRYKVTR